MSSPKAGVHYPGNLAAVRSWFPDDAACLDWLRWPDGFRCTHCGSEKGWRLPVGGWSRGGCRKRVRVLAGTVFQDTRTPLMVWFEAAWLMAVTKNGVSAAALQSLLGFGSYETAWAMCHKLRTAMGRTSVDLLSGDVEVDETFIGGVKTGGKRGRGAPGKAYVVIAVKSKDKAFGRCRLQVVPKIDAKNLGQFLHRHITPGSVVISDALRSYPPAIADTYGHKPFNIKRSGLHAHEVLPGVHRVASLLNRWLAGTHKSGVSAEHLQAYLDVHLPVQPPALACPRPAVPATPRGRRHGPTDHDEAADQGSRPAPRADASANPACVAGKPCGRTTRPSLARRGPLNVLP